MSTIEGLREWFFSQAEELQNAESVSWRIYRGHPKNNIDGGRGTGSTAEASFQKLQGHLEMEDWEPGEFITLRIYKDNALTKCSEVIYRPIPKSTPYGSRVAGIGGFGAIGANPEAYIAEKVSTAMEVYDLRRQVQDLQAEIEHRQGFFERMVSTITEHPNFDPNAIVNGIAGVISNLVPKGAQVGVQGFQNAPDHADVENEQAARITAALERLQAAFPEYSIVQLLEGLANYVDKNPILAKQLLKNVIQ